MSNSTFFERVARMEELIECGFRRVGPLSAHRSILELNSYRRLERATLTYLNAYFPDQFFCDLDTCLEFYQNFGDRIDFITPSGAVVPKKETAIEFNHFIPR